MNRKERRAAQKRGGPAMSPMAATLAQAFRTHQAGHRSDAERMYRDVLAVEPRNAAALHLLGALMHQNGRSDEAISLIRQAVAIEPRNPDYHYNLGLILLRAGRAEDAITHLKTAAELKSDHADAYFELGNAYAQAECWPDAASQFRRVLSLKPGDPTARNNLALVLRHQGSLQEAAALWEQLTKASPSFPLAQMNLGLAYKTMGRLADAEACLRRAVELQPSMAEGHYNLASVLVEQNDPGRALPALQRAFELRDTVDTRKLFIRFATACTQIPLAPELEPLLLRALSEDWANPQYLYPLCRSWLGAQLTIDVALKRAQSEQPEPLLLNQLLGPESSDHFGKNRLLLELLGSTPIADAELERLLVRLRFSLLDAVRRLGETQSLPGHIVELCCAIARQCFLNEYIFNETPEERSHPPTAHRPGGDRAARRAAGRAGSDCDHRGVPAAGRDADRGVARTLRCARAACAGAEAANRGAACGEGIARTDREPDPDRCARLVGRAIRRSALPALGEDIAAGVAGSDRSVSARCIPACAPQAARQPGQGRDPDRRMRHRTRFDHRIADDRGRGHFRRRPGRRQPRLRRAADTRARPDQYSLRTGGHCPSPIARAQLPRDRSCRRPAPPRRPWDGWKILLSLLRPGGVMRIGLYSALGRRNIVQAQDFVRTGNYQPDQEGLRICRRNLMRQAPDSPIRQVGDFADFYTASQCRNLLFGTREQHVTLPQIEAFLAENRLSFLGFDAPMNLIRRYAKQYPHKRATSDLSSWHQFETGNPDSFAGRYDFWVQKP